MMYKVIGHSQKAEIVLLSDVAKETAEKFCEEWGWKYSDEHGFNWNLDVEIDSPKIKQSTYLLEVEDEELKRKLILSNLCLIADLKMGWFGIPENMMEELNRTFFLATNLEFDACKNGITKEEIAFINSTNWDLKAYQEGCL